MQNPFEGLITDERTTMRVRLLAGTQVYEPDTWNDVWQPEPDVSDAETLIEYAGRNCYQSWDRPNKATNTNAGYIPHILDVGHFSVLEHGVVTFEFTGVSRSFTHELIRHRHFSYSELSQRFVDVENAEFLMPIAVAKHYTPDEQAVFKEQSTGIRSWYRATAALLQGAGRTRKQAREAARAVLPNSTETKIIVTGNFRAWRQFIAMRATIHADAEICALAVEVLQHLQEYAPNVFGDFELLTWVEGPGHDGRTYAYSSVSAPC